MLKKFSKLGKVLDKNEQQSIKGGNGPDDEIFYYCPVGYVEVYVNFRFVGCFLDSPGPGDL